jgi:SulP family sulfate permease
MFFGATAALEQHFAAIERSATPATEFVVLRVKRARNPDAVGVTLLEGFLERLAARGIRVLLCGVRPDFHEKIERTGLAKRLREQIFVEQPVRQTATLAAIRHAYQELRSPCADCPRRSEALRAKDLYYEI